MHRDPLVVALIPLGCSEVGMYTSRAKCCAKVMLLLDRNAKGSLRKYHSRSEGNEKKATGELWKRLQTEKQVQPRGLFLGR